MTANNHQKSHDVIIIGAGAAGLLCASMLGKMGKSVLLLEKGKKIGAKILISGGGRCNFTNLDAGAANYLSTNPHFMKSALKRYTPWDFIGLMAMHGLTYNEKKLGQLFCDQGSKAIVQMLQDECDAAKVKIELNVECQSVGYDANSESYQVDVSGGSPYSAPNLIMATGGLSIPKMGSTGFSYDIAKQFGLSVTERDPALVPFTFGADDLEFMKGLAGVALDSIVTFNRTSFRENILFTHRGLSGPAILQISSYWQLGKAIEINLLPNEDGFDLLRGLRTEKSGQMLANVLSGIFPSRFASAFVDRYLVNKPIGQFSNVELQDMALMLHNWQLKPIGTEGYRTAEVTKGGIDPDCLSSKTMEAAGQKGLYFIGECVDVTGWLGGYNFQWAWASANAAAQAIKEIEN